MIIIQIGFFMMFLIRYSDEANMLQELLNENFLYLTPIQIERIEFIQTIVSNLPENVDPIALHSTQEITEENPQLSLEKHIVKEIEQNKLQIAFNPMVRARIAWKINIIASKLLKWKYLNYQTPFDEITLSEEQEYETLPLFIRNSIMEKYHEMKTNEKYKLWYLYHCLSKLGSYFWRTDSIQDNLEQVIPGMNSLFELKPNDLETQLQISRYSVIDECERYYKIFKKAPSPTGNQINCVNENISQITDVDLTLLENSNLLNSVIEVIVKYPKDICLGLTDLLHRFSDVEELGYRNTRKKLETNVLKALREYTEPFSYEDIKTVISQTFDSIMDYFEKDENKIRKIPATETQFRRNIEAKAYKYIKDFLHNKISSSEFWYDTASLILCSEHLVLTDCPEFSINKEIDLIFDYIPPDVLTAIIELPIQDKFNIMHLLDCSEISPWNLRTDAYECIRDYATQKENAFKLRSCVEKLMYEYCWEESQNIAINLSEEKSQEFLALKRHKNINMKKIEENIEEQDEEEEDKEEYEGEKFDEEEIEESPLIRRRSKKSIEPTIAELNDDIKPKLSEKSTDNVSSSDDETVYESAPTIFASSSMESSKLLDEKEIEQYEFVLSQTEVDPAIFVNPEYEETTGKEAIAELSVQLPEKTISASSSSVSSNGTKDKIFEQNITGIGPSKDEEIIETTVSKTKVEQEPSTVLQEHGNP